MEKLLYARRPPKTAGEHVTMRREDNGLWHARTDDGELVAVNRYQNDLEPGLVHDGFTVTKIGT